MTRKWRSELSSSMLCKVRNFFTGEKTAFETIRPFEPFPQPHVSRLVEHTMQAKTEGQRWVKVSTEDLFSLLAEDLARDLRDLLSSLDDHKM